MLGSGPRATPEEAARNQRERLFGATVAACAERGYGATTVADLIALAGVSRRDFYKHFADKEACFLATVEELLAATTAIIRSRLGRAESWDERARGAFETTIDLVIGEPAAARLLLVESHTVGPAATNLVDAAIAVLQDLIAQAFDERPELEGMPREIVDALVGGVRKIAHTHLHRGRVEELAEMAPALLGAALSLRPPPQPLRGAGRKRAGAAGATASDWARLAASNDPAERIVRATLEVMAARSYQATTIGEIAEAAGVSLSTFYAHFDGKAEAFGATLYSGRTRLIGVAMPAFKRARSWPESIRALTRSSYTFLASEPEFAQLVTAGVLGAGAEAVEQNEVALEGASWPFEEGRKLIAPELDPIVPAAVTYACHALMCEWVQRRGAETLVDAVPVATYLALCPFIGPEDACSVANGAAYAPRDPQGGDRATR